MPNTCFDTAELIVPAHDPNAKTVSLVVEIHPGQVRILDYILQCGRFPFHENSQIIRWAVCWAIHTLLAPLPHTFGLIEAKMNILQDENFERQKDCCAIAVQKYLATNNTEAARRLVIQSYEEYRKIPNEYWKMKWLSTLEDAIEMLKQKGVDLELHAKPQSGTAADHTNFSQAKEPSCREE
jgi:hypothetical protein